ncbi:MAG: hypothetical protein CK424_07730 [Legionella sp.]|nr:MAG: hypothetical protein CK424_07730 [Legionella sp.]
MTAVKNAVQGKEMLNEAHAFWLKTFSIDVQASDFTRMTSMLAFLSFRFGVPTLSMIEALTAQKKTGRTLSAFVSAASGGVGLAMSYFFQPEPLRLDVDKEGIEEHLTVSKLR